MSIANSVHQQLKDYDYIKSACERKMTWRWPCAAWQRWKYEKIRDALLISSIDYFCETPFIPSSVGFWTSESWASSKYELQGSLNVTICGLQRPQHQLLVLDPHVPELLHLGLPASLQTKQAKHTESARPSEHQRHSPESKRPDLFQLCINDFRSKTNQIKPNY